MHRRTIGRLLVNIVCVASCTAWAASHPSGSPEARTERYFESIRKDPNLLLAFLLQMPKGGDLHNHLSGAIYAETLIDFAAADGFCAQPETLVLSAPPCADPKVPAKTAYTNPILYRSMIDAYSMRNWETSGQSGHDHFFDSFAKFDAVTHGNTGPMLAETAARAASQREIYQELMITPTGKAFDDMVNSDAVKVIPLADDATAETLAAMRKALMENDMPATVQDVIRHTNESETIRTAVLQCGKLAASPGCEVKQRYLFQVLRGLPKERVLCPDAAGL